MDRSRWRKCDAKSRIRVRHCRRKISEDVHRRASTVFAGDGGCSLAQDAWRTQSGEVAQNLQRFFLQGNVYKGVAAFWEVTLRMRGATLTYDLDITFMHR